MVLTVLSTLARFSLKKPKTVALIAVAILVAGFGVHYNLLKGERDKLRVAEAGYRRAIAAFVQREETLRADLLLAAEATAKLTEQRNANVLALSELREGRESDEEGRSWGAQPIPVGEIGRLCAALPEMEGCAE